MPATRKNIETIRIEIGRTMEYRSLSVNEDEFNHFTAVLDILADELNGMIQEREISILHRGNIHEKNACC